MAYQKWSEAKKDAYYALPPKVYSSPGAIDRTRPVHRLAVDGTDPFTMGPPLFLGQRLRVEQASGANSPVGTLTVTGGILATRNVWSGFDRTTAQLDAAPRWVEFEAVVASGGASLVWDEASSSGVTVA